MREILRQDYIKIGKYKVRPFSILWWVIRIFNCLMVFGGMYIFYILMWITLS